jgi:hypothetical protein
MDRPKFEIPLSGKKETEIDPPSPEAQLDISIKDDKKKESYCSNSSAESKKKINK